MFEVHCRHETVQTNRHNTAQPKTLGSNLNNPRNNNNQKIGNNLNDMNPHKTKQHQNTQNNQNNVKQPTTTETTPKKLRTTWNDKKTT